MESKTVTIWEPHQVTVTPPAPGEKCLLCGHKQPKKRQRG